LYLDDPALAGRVAGVLGEVLKRDGIGYDSVPGELICDVKAG
jgi:hypothetical protein